MTKKYIVWHIEGGLGKNVAATALLSSIKKTHPERDIVVCASYPEVFLNNPDVHRVYRIGVTPYFYDDYILGKDTLIFRHEPYFESSHILKKKHLIENWCNILGIEYTGQLPVLKFNFTQIRNSSIWKRSLPILLIQTNGGPLNSQNEYSWSRDIPYRLSVMIAEKYKETHHIIQVCKPSSIRIPGAEVVDQYISPMDLFSLLYASQKRVLIDSCLQHAAAAMGLSSNVIWIGTSPSVFGYELHKNIVANPPSGDVKLINSYMFDYAFEGLSQECPYFNLDEMFNIDDFLYLL